MGTDPTADAAFRAIFDATFDAVRRFCVRRLPADDVNDAVSEVYLVAWQKFDGIPEGSEALPWLYGVARNVVRHIERSNRRRHRLGAKAMREPLSQVPGPDVVVVRRTEDEELIAALYRLSASDQEILRLRAWECLTAPAIAAVLSCSVAAAEKRVTRAQRRLEKLLGSTSLQGLQPAPVPEEGGV